MSKKKLDELFQEKLLDFKEMPDDKVWSSIEASLDKKKKNRIIPLWWSLGGIAAALLIGFIIFNPLVNTINTDEIITDVEQSDENKNTEQVDDSKDTLFQKDAKDVIEIASEDKKEDAKVQEKENQLVGTSKKTVRDNLSKDNQATQKADVANDSWTSKNQAVAQTEKEVVEKASHTTESQSLDFKKDMVSEAEVVQTDNSTQTKDAEKSSPIAASNQKDVLIEKELNNSNAQNAIVNKEVKKEPKDAAIVDDSKKKSILEEIEEQQKEVVAEKSSKKWSAGPSVAPVYFNAIGEGSPVHSIFVPNSKSGNVNLSYGLSVAYEISSKLSVRSGIHMVDYGYDTNDVAFSSSLTASTNGQISSIDYTATAENLVLTSKSGSSTNFNTASKSSDALTQNPTRDGVMSQQLGYLEVPLELNYAILDTKFGVNVIGGVSSLFLMDNSVALISGDLTTEMGEANNINDLNFSANVGLGVNYKFSQKVRLNIEPMFKYQLNTFSETDGTFNPYSLGIYSGLSFKF